MRKKDTFDVTFSLIAVIADAISLFIGLILATLIRFDSGFFAVIRGRPDDLYVLYAKGITVAVIIYLLVFKSQGLYVRPQTGSFLNKIPRIVKSVLMGTFIVSVLAFSLKNNVDFSRFVIGLSLITGGIMVILTRYFLYKVERFYSKKSSIVKRVLIIGTDEVAVHLTKNIESEPLLRSKVIGYLRQENVPVHDDLDLNLIKGSIYDLGSFLKNGSVDQVILAGVSLTHDQIMDIIIQCERNLVTFNMVPDLFRILTNTMDVQSFNDIPMLGIGKWPLDKFWNRLLKRVEDIVVSLVGILISAPVVLVCAILIKRESKGPLFFVQERCGENGKVFNMYKLRTMIVDAEKATGPVWTVENDPRCTKIGRKMRKYNIDEIPQLWNVLKGDMSIVGPRPERPHFVEKFKENVGSYMSRHVSKPGMTGWAQVNGLRGNTSIEERIKYDLYYLENWSLAFDFKIILRTFFATKNAY